MYKNSHIFSTGFLNLGLRSLPCWAVPGALVYMLAGLIPAAWGQNTSSVFSPDVTAGATAVEYRIAYDGEDSSTAQRIPVQHGFSESWRMRLIALFSGNETNSTEFRYVRWEGQWQFLENEEAGWDSALRLELQLADGDDSPSRVRLAWTGKVDLNDAWQLRGNFLTGHQFGSDAGGGYLLESRLQLTRKLSDQWRLGFDYYGDMNDTEDFGGWDDQEHQLGPILKFKLNDRWSGFINGLHGISDGAADFEGRFLLTMKL